jgi:hypothetical protein
MILNVVFYVMKEGMDSSTFRNHVQITSRNKAFGFLPQMAFAPDLARTGAKKGH